MRDRWDDAAEASRGGELAALAYAVHLLGQDHALAPYDGSGASVKLNVTSLFGEEEELLYMSPRTYLPESLEAAELVPLRCRSLARLATLQRATPAEMENEVACCRTLTTSAIPPIDAIVHAALPRRCVLATHPDAMLAIGCTPHGPERLSELFQGRLLVLPYVPAGPATANSCVEALKAAAAIDLAGIIVLHQTLLTFGDIARDAYKGVVDVVTRAEQYLVARHAWELPAAPAVQARGTSSSELALLRRTVSAAAGSPLILRAQADQASLSFCRRDDVAALSQAGPPVAGQVRLAGRVPMLGRDVAAYHAPGESSQAVAPRIVLDPELGVCALGRTADEAVLAGEQYGHAIGIVLRANALEAFQALPPRAAREAEEAARLISPATCLSEDTLFAGEVALVTGGASGIGKACVEALLARGAAVVNLDINQSVEAQFNRPDYLGLQCDLTSEATIMRSFETLARCYGGLDMLILNAGIFPNSCRIESLTLEHWQAVMRVNLDANMLVMREAYALLKHSPRGGRVVVNASKNVLAPGAGAAAYSASKAAVTQLARVAALEWGKDRIRINQVHPDAIFDTGIWSEDVLKARAAHYGMTVQQYKTRNVLGVELNSHVVGELVAEMLGPRFEKITGAQIPVDGGSDRVI